MSSEQKRPTARDLAGSAVDLNGYSTLLKQWAAHRADKDGNMIVPVSRIVVIAAFMDQVVDELLALIPPDEVDNASNKESS